MTKPQVKEYNCETGEEIVRDATAAEIAQWAKDADDFLAKQEAQAQEQATKAALLQRLGITADEAKLLLA
jgi:hypothetical protein